MYNYHHVAAESYTDRTKETTDMAQLSLVPVRLLVDGVYMAC